MRWRCACAGGARALEAQRGKQVPELGFALLSFYTRANTLGHSAIGRAVLSVLLLAPASLVAQSTADSLASAFVGGKYIKLAGVLGVEFRLTIGFDPTTDRYRMSLLDAGSGVFDVYEGSADTLGSLLLTNPQYWRATITPTKTGWRWLYERSPDRGVTWRKSGPGAVLIRTSADERH